ncbi:MAG: cysteine desulfurase [Lachnospiraceae bacterium]|nr:cysteine desulfurase [Lachnospiraceae bacterium]
MKVYLDNSATTRCFDEVRTLMSEIMDKTYGNPSSMHMLGVEAEKYIKYAADTYAAILKVSPKEILFTSGGTESDNMALIGCVEANQRAGKHIITTKIEHPAVLEPCAYLEKRGYEITYLDVDSSGCVRPCDLLEALRDDTILVSVMYVNNEIGSLQPIEELGKLIKDRNKNTLFHVDAVQGFGKVKINPKREKIDLMSVSGHKIHGPKGVGILYINDKVKIHPLIYGGGQQRGLRSGTENVPAIAGMAKAAELLYKDQEASIDRLYGLKLHLINELCSLEGVSVNGLPGEARQRTEGIKETCSLQVSSDTVRRTAPHIVSASIEGIRAEVLLHALEDKGIYVSAGSACASNKPSVSKTLKAIGLRQDLLDSTIRFSMSVETTYEELDHTILVLKELLPSLRRFKRR